MRRCEDHGSSMEFGGRRAVGVWGTCEFFQSSGGGSGHGEDFDSSFVYGRNDSGGGVAEVIRHFALQGASLLLNMRTWPTL
mmetsp:Transcript_22401/g.39888  ORF Transcript_22401/g.39888 Transcript_22401/m.39888 type:complete len:81 (-) Transcript_22401:48-290(-)